MTPQIPFPQPVACAFGRERDPIFVSLERLFGLHSLSDVVPQQCHTVGDGENLHLQNPRTPGKRQFDARQRPGAPRSKGLADRSR